MSNEIKISILVDSKRATSEVEKLIDQLEGLGGTAVPTTTQKTDEGFAKIGASATKYLGALGVAGVAYKGFAMFQQEAARAVEVGGDFEVQLDDLSAITGVVGDNLQRLSETAMKDSVRFGTSAKNIVEAQKLVASKLAEKIDFSTDEGLGQLEEVSRAALRLKQAAGIELSTAVDATSTILNQFGYDVDQTNRVINTLAAGSKFGAAEVANIAASVKVAGAGFAQANQSIETLNGGVQILAQNSIAGSEAGTALRNMITKLQTEAEDLEKLGIGPVDVRTNGFANTLKQLQPVLNDTSALAKIFGAENLTSAQILIKNADAIEQMTAKVTDTNVAQEQAITQTGNYQFAVEQLSVAYEARLIQAFNAFAPILTSTVTSLTRLIDVTDQAATEQDEMISTVERLTEKAAKNKLTQEELDIAIQSVGDNIPATVFQFDEYGRAIGINTTKAQEFIEQQKEIQRLANQEKFDDIFTSVNLDWAVARITELREMQTQLMAEDAPELVNGQNLAQVNQRLQELTGTVKLNLSQIESLGFEIDDQTRVVSRGFKTYTGNLQEAADAVGYLSQQQRGLDAPIKPIIAASKNATSEIAALEDEFGLLDASISVTSDSIRQSLEGMLSIDWGGMLNENLTSISDVEQKIYAVKEQYRNADTMQERVALAEKLEMLEMIKRAMVEGKDLESLLDENNLELFNQAAEEKKATIFDYANAVMGFGNAIMSLQNAQAQRAVQNINTQKDAELGRIEESLEAENLSAEQKIALEERKAEVEEMAEFRLTEIRRDLAEKQKKWNKAQAFMSGSLAVLQAWAQFGFPAAIPISAIVAAKTAIEIAAINQQPIPYAEGGEVFDMVDAYEYPQRMQRRGVFVQKAVKNTIASYDVARGLRRRVANAIGFADGGMNRTTTVAVSNGEFYVPPAVAAQYADTLPMLNAGMITGPGTGTSDSIIARAEPGSFIVKAESTRRNRPILEQMVEGRYFMGGFIGANASIDQYRLSLRSANREQSWREEDLEVQRDLISALNRVDERLSKPLHGYIERGVIKLAQKLDSEYESKTQVKF